MKYQILASLFLSSAALAATVKSSIEFNMTAEYYLNNELKKIDIPALNTSLKEKGLEELPEKVIVSADPASYQKVLSDRLENAKAIIPQEIYSPILSGYYNEYPEICYRGKAKKASKILSSMLGNFLNGDQGVIAVRYGKTVEVLWHEFKDDPEIRQNYSDNGYDDLLNDWDNYDKNSDTIVVLSDLGPQGDGTELYSTEVKRCQ